MEQKGWRQGFVLHHCYKVLQVNEKPTRRNYGTTSRRSRLSISIDADDDVEEEHAANPISRSNGKKIAKEKNNKKNGGVGAYII